LASATGLGGNISEENGTETPSFDYIVSVFDARIFRIFNDKGGSLSDLSASYVDIYLYADTSTSITCAFFSHL